MVNCDEAKALAAKAKTMVFVHESGNAQSEQAPLLNDVGPNFRRAIMLSRVGVNRRDQKPFEDQNQAPNNLMQIGLGISIPNGKQEGIPGTLDAFAQAEEVLRNASKEGRDAQPAHVIGRHYITERDSAPVQYNGIV